MYKLALINFYDLNVCQLDVKTAFLNGTIEDDVYMKIPDGMEISNEIRRAKVCKLSKALYGLRISPKRWNKKFTEVANAVEMVNDNDLACLHGVRENPESFYLYTWTICYWQVMTIRN